MAKSIFDQIEEQKDRERIDQRRLKFKEQFWCEMECAAEEAEKEEQEETEE